MALLCNQKPTMMNGMNYTLDEQSNKNLLLIPNTKR